MMRSSFVPAALAFALVSLSGLATASTWADYSAAFPKNPCHDGWMACKTSDGSNLSPMLHSDAEGLPTPADFRVGWWDLQPTSAFSPFVGLSAYTGEDPQAGKEAVAEAEEPEEFVPEVDPEAEKARAAAAAAAANTRKAAKKEAAAAEDAEKARRRAEKRKKEAEAAKAEAARLKAEQAAAKNDAERARIRKEQEEAARKAAEAERKRKEAEEAERKQQAELKRQREEAERLRKEAAAAEAARKAAEAEEARKQEEQRKKAEEERKKREAEEAAKAKAKAKAKAESDNAAAAEADATCDNLVRLEPAAMLGKLSKGQAQCLEASLATAAKQTEKEKISLILMANAYSKGDKASWEKLVKRHLKEIDQSNPDLCYKYALHLSKGGAGRAYGVIKWSDVALENRTVWTGDTYTSRVYSLYKLKAAAGQKLWQKAEADHAASPSPETKKKVEDNRNRTKVMAREWYEYAKVAGKDTTKALQLCMSAAGTKDYCDAG